MSLTQLPPQAQGPSLAEATPTVSVPGGTAHISCLGLERTCDSRLQTQAEHLGGWACPPVIGGGVREGRELQRELT